MNKHDFVRLLSVNEEITVKDATAMVNSVLYSMAEALEKDQSLTFIGLGKFDVVKRATRTGRNPQTGEELQIPETKKIIFKPGKKLTEQVIQTPPPKKSPKKKK